MDETELTTNVLGVVVDKVSQNYLFCAIYPEIDSAKKELMDKMAHFEGQRVSAQISCCGTEIARGFLISGWWKVVAGELKQH